MALTYVWSQKTLLKTNSKTIICFDAVMNEQNGNFPVRVFVIDEKDRPLKISIYFNCKDTDITDTHIAWVLGDIESKINYDPNKTQRIRLWVAQYVDSFPGYVDQVYQSRY